MSSSSDFPMVGLQGLSMVSSFAGLAPSASIAPLRKWRLRESSVRWTQKVFTLGIVAFRWLADSTQWSRSTHLQAILSS